MTLTLSIRIQKKVTLLKISANAYFIHLSYFTTGCCIGFRISVNNANLSGNLQRVGTTNGITSGTVLVLVLGIGIVRYQSIGYWVLGVQLGIVLTLTPGFSTMGSSSLYRSVTKIRDDILSTLIHTRL